MEATKDFISLETAELLKNCGIESKNYFVVITDNSHAVKSRGMGIYPKAESDIIKLTLDKAMAYPLYSWWEVLWKYADEFFGDADFGGCPKCGYDWVCDSCYAYTYHSLVILNQLQMKKYKEADEYFREHCILINKQTPRIA